VSFVRILLAFGPLWSACGAPSQYVDVQHACAAIGRAADQIGTALSEAVDCEDCCVSVQTSALLATQYASEAHAACFVDPEADR